MDICSLYGLLSLATWSPKFILVLLAKKKDVVHIEKGFEIWDLLPSHWVSWKLK